MRPTTYKDSGNRRTSKESVIMIGKIYTQTEMDKATQEAYDKGREEGFEAASEAYEYDGY